VPRTAALTQNVNFLLVSVTGNCLPTESPFYCYYLALLILLGHALNSTIFPLTLYRMHQLGVKFRNQYNVSFMWMCALLLASSIDLLEYVIAGDGQVYSISIVVFVLLYSVASISAIAVYFQNFAVHGTRYKNGMTFLGTVGLFVVIVIARIWSQLSLEKAVLVKSGNNKSSGLHNGHFVLYYFVYAMVGGAQVNI
jgi:hypothetical protein